MCQPEKWTLDPQHNVSFGATNSDMPETPGVWRKVYVEVLLDSRVVSLRGSVEEKNKKKQKQEKMEGTLI